MEGKKKNPILFFPFSHVLPRFSFLTFFSGNIVVSVFSGGSVVKYLPEIQETRDEGLIPGLGRSYGKGNGNPLQYSCPEIPTDRASWWDTVHDVTNSRT